MTEDLLRLQYILRLRHQDTQTKSFKEKLCRIATRIQYKNIFLPFDICRQSAFNSRHIRCRRISVSKRFHRQHCRRQLHWVDIRQTKHLLWFAHSGHCGDRRSSGQRAGGLKDCGPHWAPLFADHFVYWHSIRRNGLGAVCGARQIANTVCVHFYATAVHVHFPQHD